QVGQPRPHNPILAGEADPTNRAQRTARATVSGRIGVGSVDDPDKYASTAAAAARPSAMAHTINDCPRPASPATNTPSAVDFQPASRTARPRESTSTPSECRKPPSPAPPVDTKPIANSTSSAGISRSVPSILANLPSTSC